MSTATVQNGEQRKRPKFRYLRIAISTVCGVLCVFVLAMWIRSYYWVEAFEIPVTSGSQAIAGSAAGTCGISVISIPPNSIVPNEFRWRATPTEVWLRSVKVKEGDHFRFLGYFSARRNALMVPYWSVLMLALLSAAAPWAKRRFSLRTLLIAATLVAVILGILTISS